jgi:phosphinothricin acetyltransferase
MVIRDADAARDAAACARIYGPFVRDTAASLEEEPPTVTELARRIETVGAVYPWLVAENENGEVMGFAYGSQHRVRASYRWAVDVSVYVDPAHHRRGVGRALYTVLVELLRDQGFRMACAGITVPNRGSVGLHEAFGFQLVGVYKQIGYKLGAWRDVGWWQLPLTVEEAGEPPADPGPRIRLGRRTAWPG